MSLVALLICIYLRANPDRDPTRSSLQKPTERPRDYLQQGGPPWLGSGPCLLASPPPCPPSLEALKLQRSGGAASQLPCKPPLSRRTTTYSQEQQQSAVGGGATCFEYACAFTSRVLRPVTSDRQRVARAGQFLRVVEGRQGDNPRAPGINPRLSGRATNERLN